MQAPPFVVKVPRDRYFVDDHCANCLEPLPEDIDGLFCSTWCQEIAGAVRYQRGAFRDERSDDPLVQNAIITKNAFLLAGGYLALGRTLSPAVRLDVKTRDNGDCQKCGKIGTDIDHIDGSSPRLDNLQLLCAACHHTKTAENLVPASAEQRAWLIALQVTRVAPDVPILLADDEGEWQHAWRGLKTARKQRLITELTSAGVSTKGLKTRLEMINARATSTPPTSLREPELHHKILDDTPLVDWTWKATRDQL